MCQTSLLELQSGTATTLEQDPVMGRVGAVLKPLAPSEVSPEMAYEITTHYRGPIPRI